MAPWCWSGINSLLAGEKVGTDIWRKSSGHEIWVQTGGFGSKLSGMAASEFVAVGIWLESRRVFHFGVGAAPLAAAGSRLFAQRAARRRGRALPLRPFLSWEQSCRGAQPRGQGGGGSAAGWELIYFWKCLLAERNRLPWARLGVRHQLALG